MEDQLFEVRHRCYDTRRAIVNENGTIYGLGRYKGCEVLVLVLDKPDGKGDDKGDNDG